ncbi:uncharacterized protein LOC135696842 [Ochlerotatus camptorhynchus]|uniref:uncharacterized protein LOC135696842 n=1 Tax=Ochlerotatus camptorhynchus TaxID=644619 RepID=UPI0031CE4152
MKMRVLVLLLVNIFCLAKFVKSYGVTEHRVDYIKTADGHEYDYHYHDGSAPRFEKTKFHHLQPLQQQHQHQQQQQQLQRNHNLNQHQQPLISKRPYKQPFKQPYFNKYFATEVHEQTHPNNEFQAAPSSYSNSAFKQQNSIPIFESHEKVRHSYVDNEDDDDDDNKHNSSSDYDEERHAKRRPAIPTSTLTKTKPIFGTFSPIQRLQPVNGHRAHKYNSYESSSESDETPVRPSTGSSHSSPQFHFLANGSSPLNVPGFHFISGGYSYFSSHPSSSKQRPQPALVEKPYADDLITTTTRRPYVAPTLTTSTPASKLYIQPRPTKSSHQRRPYIAPALTTTKRPYVAPSVLQSTSKITDPSFLALGQQPAIVNGASRFRYTQPNSKTTTTTNSNAKKSEKQSELYEPEFDIDIRIDLSSDSVH